MRGHKYVATITTISGFECSLTMRCFSKLKTLADRVTRANLKSIDDIGMWTIYLNDDDNVMERLMSCWVMANDKKRYLDRLIP